VEKKQHTHTKKKAEKIKYDDKVNGNSSSEGMSRTTAPRAEGCACVSRGHTAPGDTYVPGASRKDDTDLRD